MPQRLEGYGERKLTDKQREVVALQARTLRDYPADTANWRSRTLFDFSDCKHTQTELVEVETPYGVWGMMICVNCGTQTQRECPHVHCTWHEDGKVLVCDNCGVDGT